MRGWGHGETKQGFPGGAGASSADGEFATLEWVAWYNRNRLLEPLGYVPPTEFEKAYHDRQAAPVGTAVLT